MQPNSPPEVGRVALTAVVTTGVLQEFELLRYSFELFHGSGFQWFVQCDEPTADTLADEEDIHCEVFMREQEKRAELDDAEFRLIAEQKMRVMQRAWEYSGWEAVMFLDADLVVTSRFLPELLSVSGDLILTPHYYSPKREGWGDKYGYFNSGFLFARDRGFPHWWRNAFHNKPWLFTDQQCLDEASSVFQTTSLGPEANISYWRGAPPLDLPPLPENCMFVHVHMFQPSGTARDFVRKVFRGELKAALGKEKYKVPLGTYQLLHKAFALHVLAFLKASDREQRRVLYREIIARDQLQLYCGILEGCAA